MGALTGGRWRSWPSSSPPTWGSANFSSKVWVPSSRVCVLSRSFCRSLGLLTSSGSRLSSLLSSSMATLLTLWRLSSSFLELFIASSNQLCTVKAFFPALSRASTGYLA
eukprot:2417627-Pyramimonas_sp.AAC.1